MLTKKLLCYIINTRARKIPRQLYFSTIYNWREVRCESMSNVIVKENETLDSALRRFKRSCAKAGIQQEIRKREHYEKPSVRRKKKSEAARKRKYKKRLNEDDRSMRIQSDYIWQYSRYPVHENTTAEYFFR